MFNITRTLLRCRTCHVFDFTPSPSSTPLAAVGLVVRSVVHPPLHRAHCTVARQHNRIKQRIWFLHSILMIPEYILIMNYLWPRRKKNKGRRRRKQQKLHPSTDRRINSWLSARSPIRLIYGCTPFYPSCTAHTSTSIQNPQHNSKCCCSSKTTTDEED